MVKLILDVSSRTKIVYVLDTSDDVGTDDIVKMTDFVKNELKQYMSTGSSKIALVNFGSKVSIETQFTAIKEDLLSKLDSWNKIGGVRRFDLVLRQLRNIVDSRRSADLAVQQVVLLTSGRIPDSKKLSAMENAKQLKESDKVKITVVAIGDEVNKTELGEVSSNKDAVVHVNTFGNLPSGVDDLFAVVTRNSGI